MMENPVTVDAATGLDAASVATQCPPTGIRDDVIVRAADDLHADYDRQGGSLRRSQVDRLVLRRNLIPSEMVALFKRLSEFGISITEPQRDSDLDGEAELDPIPPTSFEATKKTDKRNPYALLTHRDEIEFGRRIQLALRIQPEMNPSLVTSSEERETVLRGRAARDRMVLANLRLVRFVTSNVRRPMRTLDPWDLYQEGSIGLMRAVEKFDPELGLRFSTYAMWWIRQAVFRGLDDKDRTIRLPVHRLEGIRRMKVITRRLALELGREPSIRELSDAMHWPLEKTVFVQRLAQLDCISIDTPLGGDDDTRTIADRFASEEPDPFEIAQMAQRTDLMRQLLERLTPRQRLVIERRFGLGSGKDETLQQVGDDLGVTRERIRQIEANALRRLQKWVDRRLRDTLI